MITDVLIYEVGEGGGILLRGTDLVLIDGEENGLYLAMFGGDDWWGNYLVRAPFKSKTENVLRKVTLNSSGRSAIEEAIKEDIGYLTSIPGTTFTVSVILVDKDRVDIDIKVNGRTFYYSWNPDKLFLTHRIG